MLLIIRQGLRNREEDKENFAKIPNTCNNLELLKIEPEKKKSKKAETKNEEIIIKGLIEIKTNDIAQSPVIFEDDLEFSSADFAQMEVLFADDSHNRQVTSNKSDKKTSEETVTKNEENIKKGQKEIEPNNIARRSYCRDRK
ncbi:hypothetical protein O0L34_g19118 [Tuta absoluta]|nr:hypothetical protein O0L34_g19118 [Tuta absoluta]